VKKRKKELHVLKSGETEMHSRRPTRREPNICELRKRQRRSQGCSRCVPEQGKSRGSADIP